MGHNEALAALALSADPGRYGYDEYYRMPKRAQKGQDMERRHPLKIERELRGWPQAKVAGAVNTTVRTISRWEQGKTLPYPYYREQLCALYGKDALALGIYPRERTALPSRRQGGINVIGVFVLFVVVIFMIISTIRRLWGFL